MGFRQNSYAHVWSVESISDTRTKLRISTSRKNKQTGEYEQDFSGFVLCVGTAAAQKAAKLTENSRIKVGECDVTTKYDAAKKVTYTNYAIFSFEDAGSPKSTVEPDAPIEDAESDEDGNKLPF